MSDTESDPFGDLEFDSCNKCDQQNAFIYKYRGKKYCHECFRSIAEVVQEKIDKTTDLKPDDYVFAPGIDDSETREIELDWAMVEMLRKMTPDRPQIAYAWHKTDYLHPNLTNSFRQHSDEKKLNQILPKNQVGDVVSVGPYIPGNIKYLSIKRLEAGF